MPSDFLFFLREYDIHPLLPLVFPLLVGTKSKYEFLVKLVFLQCFCFHLPVSFCRLPSAKVVLFRRTSKLFPLFPFPSM